MKTRLTLLLVFFLVGIFSALTRTALGVTSQSDAPQSCTTDVCGQATRSRCGATCPGASCRCQAMRAGVRAARVRMRLSERSGHLDV